MGYLVVVAALMAGPAARRRVTAADSKTVSRREVEMRDVDLGRAAPGWQPEPGEIVNRP